MVEIKTDEDASRALDQDQMDDVSHVSSSRVTRQNLGGPYTIQGK